MASVTVPGCDEFPELRDDFKALAARAIEIKREMELLELEKKEISAKLGVELTLAGAKSVEYDGYIIGVTHGRSPGRFDKEKMSKYLVNKGVDPDLIARAITRATGEAKEWTAVVVREAKRGPSIAIGGGGDDD
jgi:hypothetical protein